MCNINAEYCIQNDESWIKTDEFTGWQVVSITSNGNPDRDVFSSHCTP
jgi:hypothetical protein